MVDQSLTQKEKNIFWAAILAGTLGGIVGGLVSDSVSRLFGDHNTIRLWVAAIALLFFVCWCRKYIKQVQ